MPVWIITVNGHKTQIKAFRFEMCFSTHNPNSVKKHQITCTWQLGQSFCLFLPLPEQNCQTLTESKQKEAVRTEKLTVNMPREAPPITLGSQVSHSSISTPGEQLSNDHKESIFFPRMFSKGSKALKQIPVFTTDWPVLLIFLSSFLLYFLYVCERFICIHVAALDLLEL